MSEGLKLNAIEAEDVTVLSAAVEGAITSPGEMSYSQTARHFTLTSSRFMWEKYTSLNAAQNRIRSGLHFADIVSVKAIGISQTIPTLAMELLSITCTPGKEGTANILLNFAGGGTLRLDVECINVSLTDVGDPWGTKHIPFHKDEITGSE